jgi:hypothetical protein
MAQELKRVLTDSAWRAGLSERGLHVARRYTRERSYQAMSDALAEISGCRDAQDPLRTERRAA